MENGRKKPEFLSLTELIIKSNIKQLCTYVCRKTLKMIGGGIKGVQFGVKRN